jgi:hypothetical protein
MYSHIFCTTKYPTDLNCKYAVIRNSLYVFVNEKTLE